MRALACARSTSSTETVRAALAGASSDEVVRIPAWWLLLCIPMETVYVFEGGVDPESLKASLRKALAAYPALAGRLVPGGEVTLDKDLHTLTTGVRLNNEGVPFRIVESAESTSRVAESLRWESTPKPFVYSDRPKLRRVLNGQQGFVTVRLTSCSDGGCVLGVTINHLIADGWTIANFLHDWSELHNGREVESVAFRFVPELCQRLPEHLVKQFQARPSRASATKLSALGSVAATFMAVGRRSRLHFSDEELRHIKVQAEAKAQTWVSSNEALASHVQSLLRSELGAQQPLEMQVMVNLRGKVSGVPARSVGNYVVGPRLRAEDSGPAAVHATFRGALSEQSLLEFPQPEQAFIFKALAGNYSGAPSFEEFNGVAQWNSQLTNPYGQVDFGAGSPMHMGTWGGEGMKIIRAMPKHGGLDVCISHLAFQRDPSLTKAQHGKVKHAMAALTQHPQLNPGEPCTEAFPTLLGANSEANVSEKNGPKKLLPVLVEPGL